MRKLMVILCVLVLVLSCSDDGGTGYVSYSIPERYWGTWRDSTGTYYRVTATTYEVRYGSVYEMKINGNVEHYWKEYDGAWLEDCYSVGMKAYTLAQLKSTGKIYFGNLLVTKQ